MYCGLPDPYRTVVRTRTTAGAENLLEAADRTARRGQSDHERSNGNDSQQWLLLHLTSSFGPDRP